MSRLVESDIAQVTAQMAELDQTLLATTGATLEQIAQLAAGYAQLRSFPKVAVGVVPITAGLGTIGGFAQTVAGILNHLGVQAFVTSDTDVAGLYQARSKATYQFCADDNLFIAMDSLGGAMSENGDATGRGFGVALLLAAKGVEGKEVLVAGAGPVGCAAAKFLAKRGANVVLYDTDPTKLENQPYTTTTSVAGKVFSLVLEATPATNVITADLLTPTAIVSAPGMPLGVEPQLCKQLQAENRLIHNPLELGTAVMMADVLGRYE